MTWVTLDDHYPDHPKIKRAGPLAAYLNICGIAYCNRYLTNGHVPTAVVPTLCDFAGLSVTTATIGDLAAFGEDVTYERPLQDLVDAKLWRPVKDGYRIHDYLEYQQSAAEVKAKRQANAARVQRWRERHRNGNGNA